MIAKGVFSLAKTEFAPRGSEIPRRDQFEACRPEIRQVAGSKAPTIDMCNGCYHATGCRHAGAVPRGLSHDLTIGQRRFFRQPEDAACEAPPPVGKSLREPRRPLVRLDLCYTESNLGDGDRWQSEFSVVPDKPGKHRRIGLLAECFRHDVGIEEDQSSGPG